MKNIFIVALLALSVGVQAQQTSERTISLWGHVKNSLTRVGIKGVFVTLMHEDSTVVDTMHVFQQWTGGKDDFAWRFKVPAREQKYIIRAEHPDYETCYVNYHVRHIARNTFFDAPWHYMKKREAHNDDAHQMKELTVRATKVKMVYRGDTITFNADAFNLPDGSMLDALIRQMDGVELKDDGRILVQGEQVDELMLNGKDFFKGNNRVMLDNLPAYTVKQVQTYHKSTELNDYLGRNYDKKRFVMDVQLKREYNQGWLANVEVAGGTPFNSEIDARYLARLFAMRYTDNSRLSFYGNVNNVNESRRPGGNGEWRPSMMPNGLQETRAGGVDLTIEERDKRWKESASGEVKWQKTTNSLLSNTEQFHTDAPSTFSKMERLELSDLFNVSLHNEFILRKPFFLRSDVHFNYTNSDGDNATRSAQFDRDVSGETVSLLDSVFSASLSVEMQQALVNSNLQRENNRRKGFSLNTGHMFNYKLASGDNVGLGINFLREHSDNNDRSDQQLCYQHTPSLNSILNRHCSRPSGETNFNIAPSYRITWLNGIWLNTEYRFLYRKRDNTNDVFLADTVDLQNAYDRSHLRVENRLAVTPGYTYEKDDNYASVYYQMHFYNVNEQLDYRSAFTDTSLVQHKWTMSPELHLYLAKDNWARYFELFYWIEFETPDLFQKVNVLNDENPLVRRYGNPDLIGATNHRLQFGLSRNWRERRISHRFGGGLRFFLNQVTQGKYYDALTGITTYRPENVDGNWQTYFFNYFSMPLDKPRRLMMSIYTHGDYSCNVDINNGLSHVNNYFLENRLTLSYTIGNLTLGLPTNVEYRHADNREGTLKPINVTNFQYGLTANYNFKREDESKLPRWLQGFGLATDLTMYSRRGYDDSASNGDDLVWNLSVSRSFPNPFGRNAGGSLVARLEGFDILGQLSSTIVYIDGSGRYENVRNTLPRYLMLHLTYNFNRMPKKK